MSEPRGGNRGIKKVRQHISQNEGLIFERSSAGKAAYRLAPLDVPEIDCAKALGLSTSTTLTFPGVMRCASRTGSSRTSARSIPFAPRVTHARWRSNFAISSRQVKTSSLGSVAANPIKFLSTTEAYVTFILKR